MRTSSKPWVMLLVLGWVLTLVSLACGASTAIVRETPTAAATATAVIRRPTATAGAPAVATQEAAPTGATREQSCSITADTVLVEGAVGPSLVEWSSPCLPDADLVYVDNDTWDVWVMDERGGNKRCITCYDQNALGINFPLDGAPDDVRWKGDPEAHPTEPILFLKAENENSAHRPSTTPSIGWDNDLWALNVCTKRYTRLTQIEPGQGLQHTAISNDGLWYVYPLRYDLGVPPLNFGFVRMVFNEVIVDNAGDVRLEKRFEDEPIGQMYYEPNDIHSNESGGYELLYVAGTGNRMDPYRYEWRCEGDSCTSDNTRLQDTPDRHEEFTMFSPSGRTVIWMAGPVVGLAYNADLYVSDPEFTDAQRLTWYNDCNTWPERCKPGGAQPSRLTWSRDGKALFYGLWIHDGLLRPFNQHELHRLDFAGACGS